MVKLSPDDGFFQVSLIITREVSEGEEDVVRLPGRP